MIIYSLSFHDWLRIKKNIFHGSCFEMINCGMRISWRSFVKTKQRDHNSSCLNHLNHPELVQLNHKVNGGQIYEVPFWTRSSSAFRLRSIQQWLTSYLHSCIVLMSDSEHSYWPKRRNSTSGNSGVDLVETRSRRDATQVTFETGKRRSVHKN